MGTITHGGQMPAMAYFNSIESDRQRQREA